MQEKIILILVHGTFAKNAQWIRQGSKLREDLKKRFGNKVIFRVSLWSGGNTHNARSQGSSRLRTRISRTKSTYPNSKIILVGHSHGGTVSFMACNDQKVNGLVDGVSCLSTPFLHFTENERSRSIMTIFPPIFLFSLSAYIELNYFDTSIEMFGVKWVALFSTAAMFLLFFLWKLVPKSKPEDDLIVEKFYENTPSNSLIIRSNGDEASGVLGSASFVQWALLRIVGRSAFLFNYFSEKIKKKSIANKTLTLALVVSLFILCPLFIFSYLEQNDLRQIEYMQQFQSIPDDLNPVLDNILLGIGSALYTVTAIFFLPFVLIIMVIPIRFLLLFLYGFDVPFKWPNLRATTEVTPPGGDWRVHLLTPSTSTSHIEPMRHSEAYNSDQCINIISIWIRDMLTKESTE